MDKLCWHGLWNSFLDVSFDTKMDIDNDGRNAGAQNLYCHYSLNLKTIAWRSLSGGIIFYVFFKLINCSCVLEHFPDAWKTYLALASVLYVQPYCCSMNNILVQVGP